MVLDKKFKKTNILTANIEKTENNWPFNFYNYKKVLFLKYNV